MLRNFEKKRQTLNGRLPPEDSSVFDAFSMRFDRHDLIYRLRQSCFFFDFFRS